MTGFVGGCMCGKVRYQSSSDPLTFVLCHCRECRYVSGGAAASVVVVPSDAVKITQGAVKGFSSTGDNGKKVIRQFCPDCGTPMFSLIESNPAIMVVKAGTMDESNGLKPAMTFWTRSAPDWAHIDPSIPSFETQPAG
jgi:hypothetical protein